MNGYELSRQFFDFAFENHKCGVYHTAIYMLAIEQNNRYGWKKEFGFPTAYNCDVLGIGNRNTYLSALKDLVDWGFIEIICESKNQFKATVISLCHIKIDIATDTAGYTALDKALIWQGIGHGYAIDTIDKQVNNETNKPRNHETIEIIPKDTEEIVDEDIEEENKVETTELTINETSVSEVPDKRNKDVQTVIDTITEYHGSMGGSPGKERQFANHLAKKIKKHPVYTEMRPMFDTDEGAMREFIINLIERADNFQKRYTVSATGLYYHMEEIIVSNSKKSIGVIA